MKKAVLVGLLMSCISTNISFAAFNDHQKNKEVVLDFYQKALNEKNFEVAKNHIGSWYIQHNPLAKDGIEGFEHYIGFLKQYYPKSHSEIKRVIAEGDYVILHVHSMMEPDTRGQAIIDIFRLENNKIVEHWDVIQAIPEESANSNGMF